MAEQGAYGGDVQLEIAVQDAAGARIAGTMGADRVELCSALSLGGVTPSAALIASVMDGTALPVHVLVRPRPGDFTYSIDEVDVVLADVRFAVSAGAAGVVVGALNRDRTIDADTLARIREAAGDALVTFHRAFDLVPDPSLTLDKLSDHGVHRVLTSGGASSAVDGTQAIARLVLASSGRIEIMAGGGVTIESIARFGQVGVDAVHLSAKRVRTIPGGYRLGSGSQEGSMEWDETDPHLVARARVAIDLSGSR